MGVLLNGTPMNWDETIPHIEHIKKQALAQFISLYNRFKDYGSGKRRWGDEIEYIVVKFDHEHKKVRLCLRTRELLDRLQAREKRRKSMGKENQTLWMPECAVFMLEGIPGAPYGTSLSNLKLVEANMRMRRSEVSALLSADEALLSICFPAIGTPDFTDPHIPVDDGQANGKNGSQMEGEEKPCFPDECITSLTRYRNFLRNILARRGEKIAINVPVFHDTKTPNPFIEKSFYRDEQSLRNAKPDHIFMDHMGFGAGLCCVQMTFETLDLDEARWLFDQFLPVSPVMLALSAATPIFRSYLADVDTRWNVVCDSADDRTRKERKLEPAGKDDLVLESRRYDSTDSYIHPHSAPFNDVPLEYSEDFFQELMNAGIDEQLGRHIAHMLVRDPLQVFKERVDQDGVDDREHFENFLSSNWQSIKLKPPPPEDGGDKVGWRVEFRPTDVQLTDFENAAYCCFLALLARVILSDRLDFVIPISLVTENMARAQKRDAVLSEKFHFRPKLTDSSRKTHSASAESSVADEMGVCVRGLVENGGGSTEMTINQIVNGDGLDFSGLVPLCRQYLESQKDLDKDTLDQIDLYLTLIQNRASGACKTLARWIRDFVHAHPDYRKDSYVSDRIVYDMLVTLDGISNHGKDAQSLLGGSISSSKRCR